MSFPDLYLFERTIPFQLTNSYLNLKNNNNSIYGAASATVTGSGTVVNALATGSRTSTVNTGEGDDSITGTATATATGSGTSTNVLAEATGLFNSGDIITGKGDDSITGTADGSGDNIFGINNEGTINTGIGNDVVSGIGPDPFSGFTGGGTIDLGAGKDKIIGFGEQTVLGGTGIDDTAEFGFTKDSISLVDPNPGGSSINIIDNGVTMSFTDVEKFVFAGETFTLQQLQGMV